MRHISRRDFLEATATFSAAAALSPFDAWARGPSGRHADFDVAIVGAGSAGISAARTLTGTGRTFVVLEARDHIGGRCHCDNTSFPGIAFDLGGQWFIQVSPATGGPPGRTNNPLYDLAVRMGYKPTKDNNPRLMYAPGQPPVSILDTPVIDTFVEMAVSTFAAGFVASLDPSLDQSIAVATASEAGDPFYDFNAGFLATENGGSIERMGCLDVFNLAPSGGEPLNVPSETNYLLESGYGNFLATFAAGMPIRLNTPVTRITWGRAGVALATAAGTVTARAAIVTIPVGTLASGLVTFSPALPPAYQDALGQLPMGYDTKIGLLFDSDVFDVPQPNTFAFRFVDQKLVPLLQSKAWGKNYAVFIIGGPIVPELEARGELLDYVLAEVNAIFPRATRARLVTAVSSGWNSDPYSLGSFSYAVPGGASARVTLGTPVANRLFFAGEAVPVDTHSSVHGAWISGQTAATQALAVL